jgi:hypothetical protein
MLNPVLADHDEFARMVPEKTQAFSDSGSVLFTGSMRIGERVSRYLADETTHAADTVMAIWTSRSPAALMAAQADGAISWFGRMTAQSEAMCLRALEVQGLLMYLEPEAVGRLFGAMAAGLRGPAWCSIRFRPGCRGSHCAGCTRPWRIACPACHGGSRVMTSSRPCGTGARGSARS